MAVDPTLAARFAAGLNAIWQGHGRIGLAVSGGPDSLALLLLGHAAFPGHVEAATVDHQLRPESAAEAEMVSRICRRLGVPHATLSTTVAGGNLQAQARAARYASLATWIRERSLEALVTAHHADDQAETLLMRLNRASGAAGLAGIRELGHVPLTDIPLIRPLLSWRRFELGEICQRAGLEPISDPSNSNRRFDRVRMREFLISQDVLDIAALSRSALRLADADAALEWAAAREWDEMVIWTVGAAIYRPSAPTAVRLRVIDRILAAMGAEDLRGSAVARLDAALGRGEAATLGGVKATPSRSGWHFECEGPRSSQ